MRLLEVEVRDWRGLDRRLLADLSPGINAVFGPNEAGKSRIFQAIHYAFVESYKGTAQHKASLQSWNRPDNPFVRIAFEIGGERYELQKRYLKGGFAQLAGGGRTLRNDDAEEQLRALLGTRAAGRTGASVADQGIWPLLMVPQGGSRQPVASVINEDGRSQLQARLSAEIGTAAVGESGQRLLDAVAIEYARYFTPGGHRGTLLRDAQQRVDRAGEKLTQARSQVERQAQLAAELTAARASLRDLQERAAALQLTAQEAKAAAAKSAALKAAIERFESETRLAETNLASARGELSRRRELSAEVTALEERGEATREQLTRVQASLAAARDALKEADAAVVAARAAVSQVSTVLRAARDAEGRRDAAERLRGLREAVASIETHRGELAALHQGLADLPNITGETIANLRHLSDEVRTAQARLQGAAVQVSVRAHRAVAVDGVDQTAGTDVAIDVTADREIVIGDVATITVRPGGGEVARLRAALSSAAAALGDALRACGARSLGDAVDFHDRREANLQLQARVQERIAAVSKRPVDELLADIGELENRLKGTPEGPADANPAIPIPAAEQAVREANTGLDAARGDRERAVEAVQEQQELQARLSATAQGVQEQLEAARRKMSGMRAEPDLVAGVEQCTRALATAQGNLANAQTAYQDAGGDGAVSRAEQAARAADGMRGRVQETRTRADRLDGELQALVSDAPFESLQEHEAEVSLAGEELNRLVRQADAVMLLRTTIEDERRKVVEQLAAPVLERIQPYLKDLFPGSVLEAGDDLSFDALKSGDVREPFEDLSGGAQQQLALLTRIGLAEVLAGGEGLPLLLDDSHVYTDPQRMVLIQQALFLAAQGGLQVLLFSCNDTVFDSLGADRIIELPPTRLPRSAQVD